MLSHIPEISVPVQLWRKQAFTARLYLKRIFIKMANSLIAVFTLFGRKRESNLALLEYLALFYILVLYLKIASPLYPLSKFWKCEVRSLKFESRTSELFHTSNFTLLTFNYAYPLRTWIGGKGEAIFNYNKVELIIGKLKTGAFITVH
jgi:hypothetical protein